MVKAYDMHKLVKMRENVPKGSETLKAYVSVFPDI